MRLSTVLFLSIILCSIVISSAKRKNTPPNRTARPVEGNKNKEKTKATKPVKKEESEDTEEEILEGVERKVETDEEDESNKDSDDESDEEDDEEEGDEEEDDEEDEDDDEDEEDDDEDRSGDGSDTDADYVPPLSSEEFKGEFREQLQEKGIFYSMASLKKFFSHSDFHRATEIEDMFSRYNESQYLLKEKMEESPVKHMMPFYVVEGTNANTRRKVAQILAHRLKGLYVVNQPRVTLGPVLKDNAAKRAYYCFSKYMIANKIKLLLFSKPAVTESYWMEHASFIMAKVWGKANKMPPPGAEVYRFPEDLMVPNVTFVILNTPPPRFRKLPSKAYLFEQRMMLVYKRFTGAKIHIIRFPESAKAIADKIDIYFNGPDNRPKRNEFEIEVIGPVSKAVG